jgi:DNA-binding NarL/FixJ family response regulator
MDKIRILVADDHTLLREALCEVLVAEEDFHVVGAARDGEGTVSLAAELRPDIVLLDVEMPKSQPASTMRRLQRASPTSKVIILSMHDDAWLVNEMLTIGACGYLHKNVSRHDLVGAIRGVQHEDNRVTVSVSRETAVRADDRQQRLLSHRERQILTLVAQALSNRQIAVQLSITEGTVKRHLQNVFGKLDAVSRIDAVNKATTASLIHDRRPRRGYVRTAMGGELARSG